METMDMSETGVVVAELSPRAVVLIGLKASTETEQLNSQLRRSLSAPSHYYQSLLRLWQASNPAIKHLGLSIRC